MLISMQEDADVKDGSCQRPNGKLESRKRARVEMGKAQVCKSPSNSQIDVKCHESATATVTLSRSSTGRFLQRCYLYLQGLM